MQLGDLQVELRGIVALDVEGEGLGKQTLEALAAIALEAHLSGVERVREPEHQLQPLDAELEAFESPSGGRHSAQRIGSLAFSPDS